MSYLLLRGSPKGGPQSRTNAEFLPFSRNHAINEEFGLFIQKRLKLRGKHAFHEIINFFFSKFTESRVFFLTFLRIM